MGIFDRFPYSSTHEMNLDFMLGKATEIAESLQEVQDGLSDIDTHKAQAEQAAQASQASQAAASASAGQAAQHKTNAEDAADRAEAASTEAETAADRAETALGNITNAETVCTEAAEEAQQYAEASQTHSGQAQIYKNAAEAAKNSAELNASQAATSAGSAANSATDAASSANSANVSATNASLQASNAATSETNAAAAADRAEAASTEAGTAAQNASTAADGAIASAAAAETRINNLAASLPEDFTELNNEVNGLKSAVDYQTLQNNITNQLVLYTNAYISSAGVITLSASWDTFIVFLEEIKEYDKLICSAYQASNGRKQIAFYSSKKPSDNTYISGIAFNAGEAPSVLTLNISDIPEGTQSILFPNFISGGNISIIGVKDVNNIDEAKDASSKVLSVFADEEKAKFDSRFNYICYSDNGSSDGIAINTEELYTWGARHDFVSLKGDVRISSDGEIVMCHDAGFTLDASGHVVAYNPDDSTKIINMTYAECIALTHPNGEHICGIDSLIRTCKIYGKVAYITVRDGPIFDIAPKLFECLDKYNMRGRTIINSFTYDTLKIMRMYDKEITLSWVQTANHVVTTTDVDNAALLGNVIICGYDYGNGSPTGIANQSAEVIAYAKQKGIRFYEAIVTNDNSLNQLYDNGVMGAQIEYLPSCLVY